MATRMTTGITVHATSSRPLCEVFDGTGLRFSPKRQMT